jgi:pyruvate/2-oxoglutarate dehydrogenase complex dihydrolipoamide dehydrogenase (E3) component
VDHLVAQVTQRGITVVREAATAAALVRAGFEKVFVTTGSVPKPFDGAVHATAVPSDADVLAGPVVVVGGGMTGVETALWLADAGVETTLVEQAEAILSNNEVFTDALNLPGLLADAGVTVRTGTKAVSATSTSVKVQTTAGTEEIPAGTVLAATGYTGDLGLAEELGASAPGLEVVAVGGAVHSGRVYDALHEAFFAARLA